MADVVGRKWRFEWRYFRRGQEGLCNTIGVNWLYRLLLFLLKVRLIVLAFCIEPFEGIYHVLGKVFFVVVVFLGIKLWQPI